MEYDSAFESSFNTALDMFILYVEEYEEWVEEDKRRSLLDIAIRRENLSAMERLLKTDGIPLGNIKRYPENNLKILSLIFSHGLLLPGTEEGREAYFRPLREKNPTPEILKAVDYPLYYKDSSPLAAAISNIWFTSDKYPLLIKEECNLDGESEGLPPLYYALSSGCENKVKAVQHSALIFPGTTGTETTFFTM